MSSTLSRLVIVSLLVLSPFPPKLFETPAHFQLVLKEKKSWKFTSMLMRSSTSMICRPRKRLTYPGFGTQSMLHDTYLIDSLTWAQELKNRYNFLSRKITRLKKKGGGLLHREHIKKNLQSSDSSWNVQSATRNVIKFRLNGSPDVLQVLNCDRSPVLHEVKKVEAAVQSRQC